ncbi:M23 family metallopeptidase [Clostridium ganghwense]|uniref:M23 family metallopeptidase n=1 Tax=Clostridium ganghwense TaxID=312089 RepID=A0ABT4CSR0_9CLOT|nr:M23 family metallopeptidase [Clostridium ganghwense]MCY6372113.1 M23 family metallopeptidase [Clostridium ganghwense]
MNYIYKFEKKVHFIIVILITLILCLVFYLEYKPNAYEIRMNNECIAYVKNIEAFEASIKDLEKELNKKFKKFKFTDKFTYSKIHIEYKYLTSKNDIEKNIINNSKTKVEPIEIKKTTEIKKSTQIKQNTVKEKAKVAATNKIRLLRPCNGRVSSSFGMRNGKMHKGMDIANHMGSTIHSAYDGVVSYAGWISGYGKVIKIDHGGGLETTYAHCSSINVKKNQHVKKGDKIGEVGSTGRSTGPHVHFEVRVNGVPQNPAKYV